MGERQPFWLPLAFVFWAAVAAAQSPNGVDEAMLNDIAALGEATFAEKEAIAGRLVETRHAGVRNVLVALLEDRLYVRQEDHKVFIVKSSDETLATLELVDPISDADAGAAPREAVTRIGTNNRLRRVLKTTIARFDLSSRRRGAPRSRTGDAAHPRRTQHRPSAGTRGR